MSGGREDQPLEESPGSLSNADNAQATMVPGNYAVDSPHRRRFNPYLGAAWALVAVVLAAGISWLTGTFKPAPRRYADYLVDGGQGASDTWNVISTNLYSMGPLVLLFGFIGAVILLTVQAVAFRRTHPR